jgi:hypothetical protein
MKDEEGAGERESGRAGETLKLSHRMMKDEEGAGEREKL